MSALVLSCEGFQRHEDTFRTILIEPRFLYSSAADYRHGDDGTTDAAEDSIINGNVLSEKDLQNMLDHDDFLPIEDGPVDELTLGDYGTLSLSFSIGDIYTNVTQGEFYVFID
jgi:hypothetical protein